MTWQNVLGRVAFSNCDPIFTSLDSKWKILPAPPSWLTGHLLRKDCLCAPIPTADYAKHAEELLLLPDLAIVSKGDVGSVLLFGSRAIEDMRDIALPSDSSTSVALLKWILSKRDLDPKFLDSGPDINNMLSKCDGALLIGDRALVAARENPELIRLDLGSEWTKLTNLPMVFGVFAARKDSPLDILKMAQNDMINQYRKFKSDDTFRNDVIAKSSDRLGFEGQRITEYFVDEVSNLLDNDGVKGLELFLSDVCGLDSGPTWLMFD
tara:strand:+ start:1941 stop:2738 length:798 start_codon:yes stop_codon:yes gene_type:complete